MRCVLCESFSFQPICKNCLASIPISPSVRVIEGVSIYSFFNYSDISMLMTSKYSIFGSRILNMLSKKASEYFFSTHQSEVWKYNKVYGVGIDDCVRSYYSHSAIIVKNFSKHNIKPMYGKLKATNIVQYAGKSLEYRMKNPRNLIYTGKKDVKLFIADDIITTGTSMSEAIRTITKQNTEVLFGIILCDARY